MLLTIPTLIPLAIGGHAYLDPGTGSYLLQILLAAGMSVLFLFGLFRRKLATFFRKLIGRGDETSVKDGGLQDDD
jgi:hypothetical protein